MAKITILTPEELKQRAEALKNAERQAASEEDVEASDKPTVRDEPATRLLRQTSFTYRYPFIANFIERFGWIEIGFDDDTDSFVRAIDSGGLVWEGHDRYATIDAALADMDEALELWMQEEHPDAWDEDDED